MSGIERLILSEDPEEAPKWFFGRSLKPIIEMTLCLSWIKYIFDTTSNGGVLNIYDIFLFQNYMEWLAVSYFFSRNDVWHYVYVHNQSA